MTKKILAILLTVVFLAGGSCAGIQPAYAAESNTPTSVTSNSLSADAENVQTLKMNVTPPAATTIKKVYGERKKIRVVWKKQTKQTTGYEIYCSTDKKFKSGVKKLKVSGHTKDTATVNNLKANNVYYVKIRTYRTENGKDYYSSWSSLQKIKTLAASVPKAPKILSADWASGNKISVRWTKVKGAKGYILYRSSSKYGTYKKIGTYEGSTNLRALVKSSKNKVYYYQVKAYKISGGKKVGGEMSLPISSVKYKDSNLGYLFPSGPPTSSSQMGKYLVTVKLPVRTASGGKSYIYLQVHKKLKKEIKACFQEMYDVGFVVRASDTGSYNWRKMRSVNLMSHHAYGCVVDINWDANPMISLSQVGKSSYRPGKNKYSVTQEVVDIWKKHGFYWGGDWPEKKDYMHLTYTNN